MIISNYKQIFDRIVEVYPWDGESKPTTEHTLPDFNGYNVELSTWQENTMFLVRARHPDNNWPDNYIVPLDFGLYSNKPNPTGCMKESTAALPEFMDWIADHVGADQPVWVKTDAEILQDEVDAMTDEELHENVMLYMTYKKVRSYYKGDSTPIEILRKLVILGRTQRESRKAAAKQAAKTRAMRREKKIYALASRMKFTPGEKCEVCGKKLTDETSKQRGIGPECWSEVLSRMERIAVEVS